MAKQATTISKPSGQGARSSRRAPSQGPSELWSELLAGQAMEALWLAKLSPEDAEKYEQAAVAGLMGIAPRDELEGMMAVQLIAAHNATLAAYRRAIDAGGLSSTRHESITEANSLSRTFSTLIEALHRYRGQSRQKITVEHIHRPSDMIQPGPPSSALPASRAHRMITLEEGVTSDSEEQPHGG